MKKYFAYLLRIWSGDDPGTPVWRASLEDPHTREILAFDSVESLYDYLCALKTNLKTGDQPLSEDDLRPSTQKPAPR